MNKAAAFKYGVFKAWATINGKEYRADIINGTWRLSVEIIPGKKWEAVNGKDYTSAAEAFADII